jgi:sec-independent protein translocase protein TatC
LQEDRNESSDPRAEDAAAESGVQASTTAAVTTTREPAPATPAVSGGKGGGGSRFGGFGGGGDDGGEEEDGMLRMSFLEHLEELRSRIIKSLAGIGVAFAISLAFAPEMWKAVSDPAISALHQLGLQERLVFITPTEAFMTIWMKVPMLAAIFLASPWILYQVWAFVAPGLYRRERRWAAPFVICSAGLFILGGLFAYFLAFRFALTFLLGIGRSINVQPMVTVTEYFDLFVNVMLGIGLVFELPVLIFFLVLLRIASPAFLFRHSRYAILIIAIIAAVVTPTPDVFNMMLFCVPMWLLFYVGIFAGYLLVLHREQRGFPWRKVLPWVGVTLAAVAAAAWYFAVRYGYHFLGHWPFLTR